MNFHLSRRSVAALALAVLLALFFVRPGAQWLRARIAGSVSSALGRQVDVESVHLRLLPQPGFDLENFIVHDDPAFSPEPMLRAQEVTAALRLASLLRGRLEIARLDLTEPSLNLVRNNAGHWNLENLLERAARTPIAPTSKSKAEARPGFPYIAAARGRINFKFEQEKKPYALTDADFALWQDSENQWGMRLKAQPVRTDFNLSDTGTLKVSGSWQRAASLRRTPLNFSLQWGRAQLGQMSKLLQGKDGGWRGTVNLSATLAGSPADLKVNTTASIEDFRRYDILGGGNLRWSAHCTGRYSTVDYALSDIACAAPAGAGAITLGGTVSSLPGLPSYHLELIAQDVPIQSLVALARHAKKNIPEDLVASGKLDANFKIHRDAKAGETTVAWDGGGETLGLRLRSDLTNTELLLDRVPFAVSAGGDLALGSKAQRLRVGTRLVPFLAETHVDIGPLRLPLGRSSPATLHGWLSRSGYSLVIQGDAQVKRLLQVARTVGLPAIQPAADGFATLDLQIAGDWTGFAAPHTVGNAQLHSVHAELRGMNAPVEITSAHLLLEPDQVIVQNLTASVVGTTWGGSLTMPRQCAAAGACRVHFDLHADEIVTDELNRLLNPHPRKRPWYRWLSPAAQPGPSLLTTLQAAGKLTAKRVVIRNLVGLRVSADVALQGSELRLSNLRADVLGGKQRGEWQVNFSAKPPRYTGAGTLQRVALGQVADLTRDGWITGSATASYRITANGYTAAELFSSADATVRFEVRDGLLPHIALTGAPLRVRRFAGRLLLRDGKFDIQEGKLEAPNGIYQVSGTVSLGRNLNFKLLRDATHGFSISGTLSEPHVAPVTTPETRAALKP